jgi:ABC-type nitrate/sulfonate/bicarbonate transport system permease component
MLVIGLLALGGEALMSVLENRLLAWRPKSSADGNIAGI